MGISLGAAYTPMRKRFVFAVAFGAYRRVMAKNLEYGSMIHVLPLFLQLSLKFPLIGVLWQRFFFFLMCVFVVVCCVVPATGDEL